MDEAALQQAIQTARDLSEDDRPATGPCCECGEAGEWSITRGDYTCHNCVRGAHGEHQY
jgi:hypothetical protein